MDKKEPTHCIDPVMKYCQGCQYGICIYPTQVETYADLDGCSFETKCMFGFDIGRPEDEPTKEEFKEFEKWWKVMWLYLNKEEDND